MEDNKNMGQEETKDVDNSANTSKAEKPQNQTEDTKKYSDADVDDIINKKFAKWQKEQEKKISEAEKLAQMNAQQKIEYEKDKLEKELEELKREKSFNDLSKTARKILSESGIKDLEDNLLRILVKEDAEKTSSSVNSFINLFNDAVEKAVNERLKQGTPKKSYLNKGLTKEDILNEKDGVKRRELIKENLELFN